MAKNIFSLENNTEKETVEVVIDGKKYTVDPTVLVPVEETVVEGESDITETNPAPPVENEPEVSTNNTEDTPSVSVSDTPDVVENSPVVPTDETPVDDTSTDVTEPEVVEVFDETDTVEARMLGMSEVSRDLDEEIESTDVKMDVLEDVEKLEETVRESIEEGGMDVLSARTVQASIESFMSISKVEPLVKAKVSLEGFNDLKLRNTKTLSLEAQIVENKKSIMKSIIEAIKKIYEQLINFLAKVIDTAKHMKAKGLSLKEKISSVNELEVKDIDVVNQYQILRIGNAFPTIDKLLDGLSIIRDKAVANVCKVLADNMHVVVEGKGNVAFNVDKVLSEIKSKAKDVTNSLPEAMKEKLTVFAEELKLGNQSIVYVWPKDSLNKTEKFVYSLLLKEAQVTSLPVNGIVKETPKEVTIKSLDKSDSIKVIDEVVMNLDALIKIPDSKTELKRLISDTERLARDSESTEDQSELLKAVAKGCNSICNKVMKLQSSYRNYVIRTSNASLQVVAKSMSTVKVTDENTSQTPALA